MNNSWHAFQFKVEWMCMRLQQYDSNRICGHTELKAGTWLKNCTAEMYSECSPRLGPFSVVAHFQPLRWIWKCHHCSSSLPAEKQCQGTRAAVTLEHTDRQIINIQLFMAQRCQYCSKWVSCCTKCAESVRERGGIKCSFNLVMKCSDELSYCCVMKWLVFSPHVVAFYFCFHCRKMNLWLLS